MRTAGISLSIDDVKTMCLKEWGINLPDYDAAPISRKSKNAGDIGWSYSSWRMWLKNRIDELGYFLVARKPPQDVSSAISAVLHIFFVHLEETQEMLKNLGEDDWSVEERAKWATSRIFNNASRIPTPIDKVAWNVAPLIK